MNSLGTNKTPSHYISLKDEFHREKNCFTFYWFIEEVPATCTYYIFTGSLLFFIGKINLSEAAMSTVVGNCDTNKQWAMLGVVLYRKNYVQTNEVTEFVSYNWKHFRKRSKSFPEHRLAESERFMRWCFRFMKNKAFWNVERIWIYSYINCIYRHTH